MDFNKLFEKINIVNIKGQDYISLNDIGRSLDSYNISKNNDLSFFVASQSVRNFNKDYCYTTKGRNGCTFLLLNKIEVYLVTKSNIPIEFKKELLKFLNKKSKFLQLNSSCEMLFYNDLKGFLNNYFSELQIKRQYALGDYIYDFKIGKNILVEYDEVNSHSSNKTKLNDLNKTKFAEQNNYKLLRIKSNQNIGKTLAILLRFIMHNIK